MKYAYGETTENCFVEPGGVCHQDVFVSEHLMLTEPDLDI